MYVIMDYFMNNEGKLIPDDILAKKGIHFGDVNCQMCMTILTEREYLSIQGDKVFVTDKWKKLFDSNDLFENFWKQWLALCTSAAGNKATAKAQYEKTVKIIDPEELFNYAKDYLNYCKSFGRYSMNASTYLNPKTKQWENPLPKNEPKSNEQSKENEKGTNVIAGSFFSKPQ